MRLTDECLSLLGREVKARIDYATKDAPRGVSGYAVQLVGILVATYCNADGLAWPSVATISDLIGMDQRNIRKCLDVLEDAGLMTRVTTMGRTSTYQFFNLQSHTTDLDLVDAGADTPIGADTPLSTEPRMLPRVEPRVLPRVEPRVLPRVATRDEGKGRGNEGKGGPFEQSISFIGDPTHGDRHPIGNPQGIQCRQCGQQRKANERAEKETEKLARIERDKAGYCACGASLAIFPVKHTKSCQTIELRSAQ